VRYIAAAFVALFVTSCVLGKREGAHRGDPNTGGQSASGSGGSAGDGTSGNGGTSDAGSSGSGGSRGSPIEDGGEGDGSSGAGRSGGSGGSGGTSGEGDDSGTAGEPLQDCSYYAVHSYGGHDYYFCTNYSSWIVARDICAAGGGSLVHIEDAAENGFLFGQLGFTPTWWIGANDQTTDGEWRWVDGADNDGAHFCTGNGACAAVGGLYVNFHLGEPSAFSPDEGCGAVQSDGTWSDDYCVTVKPFICELE
jgi:hypothetical protein